ncbi:ATP-binding protein [Streptomyces phaeofaciens]|uniref:ATP-binding protein n=1 Tax=Streptomyces phaeofaciens TaxID=68254 RepID=UPI000AEE6755|nr:ATP-binding protein [Streptomyces phaeofaciens]
MEDALWPQRLRQNLRASLTYWGYPELIDDACLLLSELATNALRYGEGDLAVKVCLRGSHCVIEVADGSSERPVLREAGLDDENGRGLLLLDCLAEQWGVSDDGTSTWCTLRLPERALRTPMEPSTPVVDRISMDLPADTSAPRMARIRTRSALTLLGWEGPTPAAVSVISTLVDNAIQHGQIPSATEKLDVVLSITADQSLLIDVVDANPSFPRFGEAVVGERGSGLWTAAQQGAVITYSVCQDFSGKTVRAALSLACHLGCRPAPSSL